MTWLQDKRAYLKIDSLEHPKHMLKSMDKIIFRILRSRILFISPMDDVGCKID